MPIWIQWIIGIGALIGAITVIWTKLICPLGKLHIYIQQILPLLAELNYQFKGNPMAFSVLEEIVAEFKTDSGTTLRDIINKIEMAVSKLEIAAKENQEAAVELRIKAKILEENVEVVKRLASEDRQADAHRLKITNDLVEQVRSISNRLEKE